MTRPYIITVASEKGGVGKTTLAINLAIYLKALEEKLPVTLFSFDNHFSVDRMFRIGKGAPRGEVADLFGGRKPEELIETGEYGVQFIPSSRNLHSIRQRLKEVDLLARILADSALSGLVLIDTRPDLDIFTRNALFASDRVIIPVKDAPSLENSRNIYDFFDAQGLSRKPLRLLPCLVDSRIRYQGPFKDPYQLLRGYAINRGYRCLEGFIAKSPKVESLNTNPEGRIYPVLTHGRGTEVHSQFTDLARQLQRDIRDEKERRLQQVHHEVDRLQNQRRDDFIRRRERLFSGCLVCGRELVSPEGIAPAGYYAETWGGETAGFVEEECFAGLVLRQIFKSPQGGDPSDPLRDLFRESSQRSYFVLRRAPDSRPFYPKQQICFHRFDEEGIEISSRLLELEENTPLFRLASHALREKEGFLLIRRVGTDFPEEILCQEDYSRFQQAAERISAQLR